MSKQINNHSFWALDFDRCLGNTEALYELFATILQERGVISVAKLDAAHQQVKATGGSFNLCGYVLDQRLVSEAGLHDIGREYVERGQLLSAMRQPGVQALLTFLGSQSGVHYGIVTYGDPYWQRLKIKAAGLDTLRCLVVDSAHKVAHITSWYDTAANGYTIPAALSDAPSPLQVATEVVLVDDKPQAFTDIHSQTRGYWVAPHTTESLADSASMQVTHVPDLVSIIQHEQLAK